MSTADLVALQEQLDAQNDELAAVVSALGEQGAARFANNTIEVLEETLEVAPVRQPQPINPGAIRV